MSDESNSDNNNVDVGDLAGAAVAWSAGQYATITLGYAADFAPGFGRVAANFGVNVIGATFDGISITAVNGATGYRDHASLTGSVIGGTFGGYPGAVVGGVIGYGLSDPATAAAVSAHTNANHLNPGTGYQNIGQFRGYQTDIGYPNAPGTAPVGPVTGPSPITPKIITPYTPEQKAQLDALPENFCFLEGTMIDMWPLDLKPDVNRMYNEQEILAKVWQKPIEEVTPQDWVVSYDDEGRLKPGRVTRTFQNHSKHILDLHGLMITPGHATYCAKVEGEENRFAGKHVPIIDILRSDGSLQRNDGTLIRAATGCEVGSEDDEQFWAFLLYEDADGTERVRDKCQLRFGTRWMLPNGNHFSMREYLEGIGVEIIKDGPHKGYARFKKTGVCSVFAWTLSESLPKPEDYVLQRSQVTLEEIYEADEWEAVGPQIPAPFMGEAGRSYERDKTPNTGLYASATSSDHLPPNIPHSMRNSPNQPTMSRKQRRAMEAKQRKSGKQPKRTQTIH